MVKTPEEYFSDQDFDLSVSPTEKTLNSAEKAFVEKYLGSAALADLPAVTPEAAMPLAKKDDPPATPAMSVRAQM